MASAATPESGDQPGFIDFLFIRHGETDCNASKTIQGRGHPARLTELGLAQAHDSRDLLERMGARIDILASSSLERAMRTAAVFAGSQKLMVKDNINAHSGNNYNNNANNQLSVSSVPSQDDSLTPQIAQTAESTETPILCYRGFDEVSYGSLESRSFGDPAVRALFAPTVDRQLHGELDWRHPDLGGESVQECLVRSQAALADLIQRATALTRQRLMERDESGCVRAPCVAVVSHGHLLKILITKLLGMPPNQFWVWEPTPGRLPVGNCAMMRLRYDLGARRFGGYEYLGDHVRHSMDKQQQQHEQQEQLEQHAVSSSSSSSSSASSSGDHEKVEMMSEQKEEKVKKPVQWQTQHLDEAQIRQLQLRTRL